MYQITIEQLNYLKSIAKQLTRSQGTLFDPEQPSFSFPGTEFAKAINIVCSSIEEQTIQTPNASETQYSEFAKKLEETTKWDSDQSGKPAGTKSFI